MTTTPESRLGTARGAEPTGPRTEAGGPRTRPSKARLVPRLRTERGAGGGSVVLVGGMAVTSVLNYGFGVALAWLLPPEDFGAASVIMNVLLLAAAVLAAAFPWVLARTLARVEIDRPNRLDADATFRAALVGNVLLGVVLASSVVGVQLVTGRVLPGAGWQLTLLIGITIVVLSLASVLFGALHGTRRFDAIGLSQVAETLVRVVGGLVLVGLCGADLRALAGVLLVSIVVAVWLSWRALGDVFPRRGQIAGARTFAAAVPMGAGTISFGLLTTLDILLLSALGHGYGPGFGAVAMYQVAATLARAAFLLSSSVSEAVFPFVAKAGGPTDAHRRFMVGFRWVPLALVPIQLVLLVAPESVLGTVFPAEYAAAADLMRVVSVGTIGLMVADMFLKALFARGLTRSAATGAVLAVGVQLVTLLVLVPRFGAAGAAVSFALGSWAAASLLGGLYLRHHKPGRVRGRTAMSWVAAVGGLILVLRAATLVPRPLDLLLIAGGLCGYAAAAYLWLVPEKSLARARGRR